MITRRRLLGGVGAATCGALAGCLGAIGSGDGADDDYDGLTLETLSVGGSPGGPVPVAPERVTLLDFFATWCAPCKPQMAELRRIEETFPDLHLLSITSERDDEAIRSFWREYDGTWPVAQDPDLRASSQYQAGRVPTMILIDEAGEERWRHSGLAAAESIRREIEAVGLDPE